MENKTTKKKRFHKIAASETFIFCFILSHAVLAGYFYPAFYEERVAFGCEYLC